MAVPIDWKRPHEIYYPWTSDVERNQLEVNFQERAETEYQRVKQIRTKKTKLLLDLFQIDEFDGDVWRKLAMALARNHVPGFKLVDPTETKPKFWTIERQASLLFQIEEEVKNKSCTESNAIRNLIIRVSKNFTVALKKMKADGTEFIPPFWIVPVDSTLEKHIKNLQNIVSRARKVPNIEKAVLYERVKQEKISHFHLE